MLAYILCSLWLVLPQVADTTRATPPDTLQEAPDTQAVVLPSADSIRLTPLPNPDANTSPQFVPPAALNIPDPQQTPQDTLLVADSLDAASADTVLSAQPSVPADTSANRPGTDITRLFQEAEREFLQLQRGIGRQFTQLRNTFTLTRLLLAVLALVLTYFIVQVVLWLLERFARWRPAYAYRVRRVVPLVRFSLWFVAVWIILGSLFAGSVVVLILLVLLVGVAVAVTAFQFLRDLAGGLILTFEQPFQIGSLVTVGPHTGVVQKIGLRSFALTCADGSTAVIPNGEVLHQAVTAMHGDVLEALVTVELPVPEKVDLSQARMLVRESAYASAYLHATKGVTLTLLSPEEANGPLRFRLAGYVFDRTYTEMLASDLSRLGTQALAQATASQQTALESA